MQKTRATSVRRALLTLASLVLVFAPLLSSGSSALASSTSGTGFDAAYFGESAFLTLNPGDTGNFAVGFTNTGSKGWVAGTADQINLAICNPDKITCNVAGPNQAFNNGWLGTTAYAQQSTAYVGPGQTGWFSYSIKVPANATTGNYSFNGDLVRPATGEMIHQVGYYQLAFVNGTPPPTAATVTVTPASATLVNGATEQFTATAKDANGATIANAPITWAVNPTTLGTITSTGLFTAKASGSGTGTVTATSGTASGSANVTVIVGNTSTPAAPSAPALTAASDSGASNSDRITSVTTPTFTGTAEIGSTVKLYAGTTLVGSVVADPVGNYQITSATLSEGTFSFTATATNASSGNTGPASTVTFVTIDTTAPAAPSAPTLTAASDTGVSSTDRITSVTTPTVTGTAEIGSVVTLYDGATAVGSATASGTGTYSITSSALTNGVHSLTTKAVDAAGNISAASAATSITVDTTAPTLVSASGAPADATGTGTTPTLTVTFSEPVYCPGTSSACAAQFSYDPDGAGALAASTGTTMTIAPNGLTATITFSALSGNVTAASDTLTYSQSATAGNRVKDLAGNDLTSPATVNPTNP